MSCFFNGEIRAPRHFRLTSECEAGQTESISIDLEAPCELQMEQLTCHWEAVPTTSEELKIEKISVDGSRFNTVLRAVDPSTAVENITDLVCVIPFRWTKGDHVKLTYPNTDDQNVGAEIMLVQVF